MASPSKGPYEVIDAFFDRNRHRVAEIEILQSSPVSSDILIDGNCIGIPKKPLFQAFLSARKLFWEGRTPDIPTQRQATLNATRVILLYDPEYITAINYRKRRLMHFTESISGQLQVIVSQEIHFVDSILCSPLHRQTKSPSLWYHRSWLLATFPTADATNTRDHNVASPAKEEFLIVFKSGEMHPNNYYAWHYARQRLVHLFTTSAKGGGTTTADMLYEVTELVLDWCLRHHSDTSGWSFLLFLLQNPTQGQARCEQVMFKAVDMASTFKWKNEAIRSFLRSALATPKLISNQFHTVISRTVTTNDVLLGSGTDTEPKAGMVKTDIKIEDT